MIVNTMYVYYGSDRLPYKDKERLTHYPIIGGTFMGASNTTKIRFYVEQLGDIDSTWIAIAKLPNGKTGSQLLIPHYDSEINENYVEMSLTNYYTQAKGDLYISIQGYEKGEISYDSSSEIYTTSGNPIIQATGAVKISINYSTQYSGSSIDDEITPEDIYSAIGEKLNKNSTHYVKVIDTLDNLNTGANENYLNTNDIVYDKETKYAYQLSGTYPSFVANKIKHCLILANDTSFPYDLSDSELELLNNEDALILYNEEIYRMDRKSDTTAYRLRFVLVNNSIDNSGYYGVTRKRLIVDLLAKIVNYDTFSKTFYDKSQIDDIVTSIKGNEFTLVDTTTYPTLNSFLESTGEEGVIYLYPISGEQNNYYKYIWESDSWLSLGSTEFDFSQYYNKTEIDNMLSEKENVENKVTTLSAFSTNTQYPSAKAVYDNMQEIREVAEGKCKSFLIDTTFSIEYIKEQLAITPSGSIRGAYLYSSSGLTNITNEVLNSTTYDNVANPSFDTTNTSLTLGGTPYIVIRNPSETTTVIFYPMWSMGIKNGDIFIVIKTAVPDRWAYVYPSVITFYELESDIDLNNSYKKNESIVPTSDATYNIGSSSYKFDSLFLTNYIYFGTTGVFGYNGSLEYFTFNKPIAPVSNGTLDLGTSTYKWKELYLSGNANVGANLLFDSSATRYIMYGGTNFISFSSSTVSINQKLVTSNIEPNTTNAYGIGTSSKKYAGIWVNAIKGVATYTQAQYDALVSGGTVDSDTFYFIEEE